MLKTLHNKFRTIDALGDAKAAVHNPTFRMMKGETFERSLGRFNTTMAPQCSQSRKISNRRWTITLRLQEELSDDLNSNAPTTNREAYHTDFQAELKREERCVRCLSTGHRFTQKAPCQGPQNSYQHAKMQLEQLKAVKLD